MNFTSTLLMADRCSINVNTVLHIDSGLNNSKVFRENWRLVAFKIIIIITKLRVSKDMAKGQCKIFKIFKL